MLQKAMLIFLLILTVAEARTCYPSMTTMTPYNVLDEKIVETQRGCEVLCDAKTECVGFSFKDLAFDSSCVLLSVNTANEICIAQSTVFLKKTSGCAARSNLTAEFGVDPCIDSMIPIVSALGLRQIWPQIRSILYVIRAVDANGKRITLDNDKINFLEWKDDLWVYRYDWNTNNVNTPIVAAVCAVVGPEKCPCAPYAQILNPPNYPALPETDKPCGNTPAQIYFELTKTPQKLTLMATDTAVTKVTCKAGMWIVWRQSDTNSFGVSGLSCVPS